jgi:hypothetical protein
MNGTDRRDIVFEGWASTANPERHRRTSAGRIKKLAKPVPAVCTKYKIAISNT